MKPCFLSTTAASILLAVTTASAQETERQKITEEDKQVFRNFKEGMAKKVAVQEARARQTMAIMNLRQIGLALFEFEAEYGFFPSADTAVTLKETTEFKGELKAETANDCFFQLIVANIVTDPAIFQSGQEAGQPEAKPAKDRLEKCFFAYLPSRSSAGNPGRPMAVAPLIKGTMTFDRRVFAGKAVVLRKDNSVSSIPIDEEGRAIVDGRDLFDPGQPYWKGEEPTVKWPAD